MKNSIGITAVFVLGIVLGRARLLPSNLLENDYTLYALYFLLFFIGIVLGSNKNTLSVIKQINWKIVLVPAGTIVGTYLGVICTAIFLPELSVREVLAVGSGFGYYSLSSIIITNVNGSYLGTIALISNLLREIITLLMAPIIVRISGKISLISSGGATSMDSTLPIIIKYSGERYGIISIFNGLVLTILVPFLVTFILNIL